MRTTRLFRLLSCVLLALPVGVASAADKASDYPNHPIRLVVTYPPGGGTDFVAREVGNELGRMLGQPVIIDNKGGAGGSIGTSYVANAAADGYTLLFGTTAGMIINPLIKAKLPYDPVKDFAPVSLLAITPQMLVVDARLPIRSVRELIAYAKANPGKLNYGSVGIGAPNHVATEMLKSMAGIDMVHVPYKGAGPVVADMLAGTAQLTINPLPPLLPHVRDGSFRALAVTTTTRSTAAPDVPTMAEAGVPGYNANFWYSIFVASGTPPEIIAKLNAALVKIMADPAIRKKMLDQGVEPATSTPRELASLLVRDTERLAKVVKSASITAE